MSAVLSNETVLRRYPRSAEAFYWQISSCPHFSNFRRQSPRKCL